MASFSVSPSPYNPVKLELGIWLVFVIPVWLTIRAVSDVELTRLLLLAAFSCVGAVRLLWRVQRIQVQLRQRCNVDASEPQNSSPSEDNSHGAG